MSQTAYTALVDDPLSMASALSVALDFVKGNPVDPRAAELAVVNVLSFGLNELTPAAAARKTTAFAMAAACPQLTDDEVDAAFAAVMSKHKFGASATDAGAILPAGTWLTILKAIIAVLPSLLPILGA